MLRDEWKLGNRCLSLTWLQFQVSAEFWEEDVFRLTGWLSFSQNWEHNEYKWLPSLRSRVTGVVTAVTGVGGELTEGRESASAGAELTNKLKLTDFIAFFEFIREFCIVAANLIHFSQMYGVSQISHQLIISCFFLSSTPLLRVKLSKLGLFPSLMVLCNRSVLNPQVTIFVKPLFRSCTVTIRVSG